MVDVSQVMIDHPIICKIHGSRLATHVCNEVSCSCSCTKILAFLSMKLEILCPLLFVSPFSRPKRFFLFSSFDFRTLRFSPQVETRLLASFSALFWSKNFNNGNCRYCHFLFRKRGQNQNRDPPSSNAQKCETF